MALPSLALGIGMQGTPRDYTELIRAKEIGKARNQQKKQDQERKRLEGVYRRINMQSTAPMTALHRREVFDESAKFVDMLSSAIDDPSSIDPLEVVKGEQRIVELAKRRASQYNMLKNQQNLRNSGLDDDEIDALFTNEDPNELLRVSSMPGSSIRFNPNTRDIIVSTTQRVPTDKLISDYMENAPLYIDTKQANTETIGSKRIATIGMKPGALTEVANFILSPQNRKSVEAEYRLNLKRSNSMPDLTTQEGIDQFNSGLQDYVAEKISSAQQVRGRLMNVTPSKGRSGSGSNKTADMEIIERVQIDNPPSPGHPNADVVSNNKILLLPKTAATAKFETFTKGERVSGAPYGVGYFVNEKGERAPMMLVDVAFNKNTNKVFDFGGDFSKLDQNYEIRRLAVPWTQGNKGEMRRIYPDVTETFKARFPGLNWDGVFYRKGIEPGQSAKLKAGEGKTEPSGKSRWSKNVVKE